jgi:hypothetical protein
VAKIINLHFDSSLDQNGTTTSEKNKESEKKGKKGKKHIVWEGLGGTLENAKGICIRNPM